VISHNLLRTDVSIFVGTFFYFSGGRRVVTELLLVFKHLRYSQCYR